MQRMTSMRRTDRHRQTDGKMLQYVRIALCSVVRISIAQLCVVVPC